MRNTKEGNVFSWISGTGSFKESAFKQDLQILTYFYLNEGYMRFRYDPPVVTVSDDKKWLFISIYVDEGQRYNVGDIDFGGDLLYSKEELAATMLQLQVGTGLLDPEEKRRYSAPDREVPGFGLRVRERESEDEHSRRHAHRRYQV